MVPVPPFVSNITVDVVRSGVSVIVCIEVELYIAVAVYGPLPLNVRDPAGNLNTTVPPTSV
jgi:hypothetical protein